MMVHEMWISLLVPVLLWLTPIPDAAADLGDNRRRMDLSQAQAILEAAHSAFISMDEQGKIVYWNERAEAIFQITKELAIGKTVAEAIIPSQHQQAHRHGLERFLDTGKGTVLNRRLELSGLRSDGEEFPIEMTISALREQEHERWSFHAFISDISERRQAEAERLRLLGELESALHGSEQRLSTVINSLAEAVTIRGVDGHLAYANEAALKMLGFESAQALHAVDPQALLAPYAMTDEDGEQITLAQLPSVRLLEGDDPPPLMLRAVRRDTSEERWSLLKAAPVLDRHGRVEAAVTIIEDVTAAKRAASRMEFLARAGQVFVSTLDYEQTLRNLVGLAVPDIADWCAVDLFGEDVGEEPVAVSDADPVKRLLARRLSLGASAPSALHSRVSEDLLRELARGERELRQLRDLHIRSLLSVPLRAGNRIIGALTMMTATSGRSFGAGDVELAEQIASRAALAVEHARLYTERSAVARTLQHSLLPDALPQIPGWEAAALYRPAGHGNEVGGDFYDLWQTEAGWLAMVGDVTGKGYRAAAVTSLVRHTARAASEFDPSPAGVLHRVDRALRRRPTLSVCTAVCVTVDGDAVCLAVGGHPLPLRLGPDGVAEIGRHGPLLGAFEQSVRPETELTMRDGETLVAFTDGVTDTLGAGGERFGERRLRQALAALAAETPATIVSKLSAALEDFQVGPQADDTAIVAMRHTGGG